MLVITSCYCTFDRRETLRRFQLKSTSCCHENKQLSPTNCEVVPLNFKYCSKGQHDINDAHNNTCTHCLYIKGKFFALMYNYEASFNLILCLNNIWTLTALFTLFTPLQSPLARPIQIIYTKANQQMNYDGSLWIMDREMGPRAL